MVLVVGFEVQCLKWLVCLFGGKDSYILLVVFIELKWCGLLLVDLVVCNLDQVQFGFLIDILLKFFMDNNIEYIIVCEDIYLIVMDKILVYCIYCLLCLWLWCGIFYWIVWEQGCEVIVFGYYCEDIFEIFFMNLFYGGCLVFMLLKFVNDEGDLLVFRLLVYVVESDIVKFLNGMNFLIILCNLCGFQDGLQCEEVKCMLQGWEKEILGCLGVMVWVLGYIWFFYLLDCGFYDFMNLRL